MTVSAACATTVCFPRYRFTGKERDAESGNDYFGARYYNPATGRFLSEDPLGFAGSGPNLYAYAGDDPIDLYDPFGESQMYGNWCGPDWTGGRNESYDPSHDLPFTLVQGATSSYMGLSIPTMGVSQTPYYSPHTDNLDGGWPRCREK